MFRPHGFSPSRRFTPHNSPELIASRCRPGVRFVSEPSTLPLLRASSLSLQSKEVVPAARFHTPRRIPLTGSRTASLRPLPSCCYHTPLSSSQTGATKATTILHHKRDPADQPETLVPRGRSLEYCTDRSLRQNPITRYRACGCAPEGPLPASRPKPRCPRPCRSKFEQDRPPPSCRLLVSNRPKPLESLCAPAEADSLSRTCTSRRSSVYGCQSQCAQDWGCPRLRAMVKAHQDRNLASRSELTSDYVDRNQRSRASSHLPKAVLEVRPATQRSRSALVPRHPFEIRNSAASVRANRCRIVQ
jgi:hypothetical protein